MNMMVLIDRSESFEQSKDFLSKKLDKINEKFEEEKETEDSYKKSSVSNKKNSLPAKFGRKNKTLRNPLSQYKLNKYHKTFKK